MKQLILFTITIFSINIILSQSIVDMAGDRQTKHYNNGQYYIKDINNYFNPYEGTWQYTNGNAEFRLTLTKVEMYHDTSFGDDYYIDGLFIQYQKYEDGILVFESPLKDYPSGIIKEFGKLRLTFTDYERVTTVPHLNSSNHPGHKGHLDLIPNGSGDYNLKFKLFTEQAIDGVIIYEPAIGNPYHSTPTDIVMTKM